MTVAKKRRCRKDRCGKDSCSNDSCASACKPAAQLHRVEKIKKNHKMTAKSVKATQIKRFKISDAHT